MKRDVDLARQLLFDIESRGSECSFGSLHAPPNGEAVRNGVNGRTAEDHPDQLHGYPSESVRYHLRLLIDAGFVKEVDRTTAGVLCVRLTHAGHELLDLCRSDLRWRDAKACCLDTTGGLSLTVLRAILTKWAVESAAAGVRYHRRRSAYRPLYYHRVEPRRRYESARYESGRYEPARYESRLDSRYWDARSWDYSYDSAAYDEEDLRLVRTRPDYRESWVHPVERTAYERPADRCERDYVVREEIDPADPTLGVSLPVSLI